MWDLIVSVPDHCLSFYFPKSYIAGGRGGGQIFLSSNFDISFPN